MPRPKAKAGKAKKAAKREPKYTPKMVVIKEKEKIVDIGSMVRNADPAYILPRGVTARVIVAGRGYCDVRSSNQKEFVNALLAIAWKDIEDMERHMGGPDRPSDPSDFNLDV